MNKSFIVCKCFTKLSLTLQLIPIANRAAFYGQVPWVPLILWEEDREGGRQEKRQEERKKKKRK